MGTTRDASLLTTEAQPWLMHSVGLLTGLLVLALSSGVAAQSELPPSGEFIGHGRVDGARYPFVIEFPEDWAMYDLSPADVVQGLEQAEEAGIDTGHLPDPDLLIDFVFILAEPPPAEDDLAQTCTLQYEVNPGVPIPGASLGLSATRIPSPAELLVFDTIDMLYGDILVRRPRTQVYELDAGPVVQADTEITHPGGVETAMTMYLFVDHDHVASLTCAASVRPADSWRGVAESFEFRR